MRRFLIFALSLLLLTGCAAQETPAVPAASSPAISAAASIDPPAVNMVELAEALRADLEAQGLTIREIQPYEGDLLVYAAGDFANSGRFFWYYADTDTLAPLYFCSRNILDYEILYTGCIRILAGEDNVFDGWKDFPAYCVSYAALPLKQSGEVDDTLYAGGTGSWETYYAPIEEPHTVGCLRKESVVDMRITASGAEIVFGPVEVNTMDFFAAASSPPLTDIACEGNVMTLTFRKTTLTSGEPPVYEDPGMQENHAIEAEAYGFPTSFPSGTVEGSSLFIEKAEIQESGDDTILTLTLTEKANLYTVMDGQLLRNESRPYLHLVFKDDPPWW